MSSICYAAVEGDPLDSGEGGYVYGTKKTIGTIEDGNGQQRDMVFIGDEGYCAKCQSTGSITYGAGVNERRRMVDLVNGGRLQAVGGDIVLCKCSEPARIIAVYGRRFMIRDRGEADRIASRSDTSTSPVAVILDQQFMLKDAGGNALADTYYTARLPSGELVHGTTDSQGRTGRYRTDGKRSIHIYIGHRGRNA